MKYYHKNNLNMQKHFAFNVWSVNSAKAIIDASLEMKQTIFIQVSAKVFDEIDTEEFILSVKKYIHKKNASVIVHLDHSKDINQIRNAINLGWDSVMIDGSHLPLKENIALTNRVVDLAKTKNVLVEAEIGQIKGVEDGIIVDRETSVSIEDVQNFVSSTNVDLLAVAIGTAHGQYGEMQPNINYTLLKK